MNNDASIKTLFLPFDQGHLPRPAAESRVLFLNAQDSPALKTHLAETALSAQQDFKPHTAALTQNGIAATPDLPGDNERSTYDLALVLGGKQQKETLCFIAHALDALKPGGTLICAAENDLGGKRLGKQVKQLGLSAQEESKHHARVVWAQKPDHIKEDTARQWIADGARRTVTLNGTSYTTRPGIFGWDKIDKGSALLAAHLPPRLKGKGADFGCGYGFLSHTLLQNHPDIKALYALDADARAVSACQENLKPFTANTAIQCLWEDLTRPLARGTLPPLDWTVMNPPFHEGKATADSIGQRFIATAAAALKPKGTLWMVANAHLPYEAALQTHFKTYNKIVETGGFKIFEAIR